LKKQWEGLRIDCYYKIFKIIQIKGIKPQGQALDPILIGNPAASGRGIKNHNKISVGISVRA